MSEPTSIDMREFGAYQVVHSEDEARPGWAIITVPGDGHVFGAGSATMDDQTSDRLKAFCQYWCEHLNIAYASGRFHTEGKSLQFTDESRAHLDELYRKAFGS